MVALAPTWDAFRGGLKRNIRESLRHCYNSLKRDGLSFELEIAQAPDAVRNALHTFFSLHAMRAGLTRTVTHPDRFPSETSRRFLYEVCERLAARDAVRVFVLKIRGCVVAVRIAFVVGEHLYLYYSGFDPRWARYSVSTTIVAEAMRYAIDQGLTGVNLSTGTDVSKTRWGARLVPFQEAIQTRPRMRSRVTYAAYRRLLGGQSAEPRGWRSVVRRRLPVRSWTYGGQARTARKRCLCATAKSARTGAERTTLPAMTTCHRTPVPCSRRSATPSGSVRTASSVVITSGQK